MIWFFEKNADLVVCEIRRAPGELERLLETVLERETEPEPGVSGGGPRR